LGLITGQVRDEEGTVRTDATVSVYLAGTATLANLFSNRELTSGVANPATVTTRGTFDLFAADGLYDVVIARPGVAAETIASVSLLDAVNVVLLNGRSGGQVIYGGIASAQNLTLSSTSVGTKGKIFLGSAATSGFDEVNGWLGIGTATPLTRAHLSGTSTNTGSQIGSFVISLASGGDQERIAIGYETAVGAWLQSMNLASGFTPMKLNAAGGGLLVNVHNVAAGAVTAKQALASGTYTPTISTNANIAATANPAAQWIRVGSVVTVSGQVDIDTTTGSTASSYRISLPVGSTFTGTSDLAGVMTFDDGATIRAGTINANVTALVSFYSEAGAANKTHRFHFTYVVR
jgi:hypothetical protein